MPYNFGPAAVGERIVFGCERPDSNVGIGAWADLVQGRGVRRVCCLLPGEAELLASYRTVFGADRVHHAPITDYQYATRARLVDDILPYLFDCEARNEPVVVHCWAGSGRTGHVLAAWLVAARGVAIERAPALVAAVPGVRRDPREAETEALRLDEVLGWARQVARPPRS